MAINFFNESTFYIIKVNILQQPRIDGLLVLLVVVDEMPLLLYTLAEGMRLCTGLLCIVYNEPDPHTCSWP
jgi:hypothetical protein